MQFIAKNQLIIQNKDYGALEKLISSFFPFSSLSSKPHVIIIVVVVIFFCCSECSRNSCSYLVLLKPVQFLDQLRFEFKVKEQKQQPKQQQQQQMSFCTRTTKSSHLIPGPRV